MEYSRNETLIEIGERIRDEREKRSLTQTELATELKKLDISISRQKIAKWETGIQGLQPEEVIKLADFFDIDCDYLLRGVRSINVSTANKTGLSEKTITQLAYWNAGIDGIECPYPNIISKIIDNDKSVELLRRINLFLSNEKWKRKFEKGNNRRAVIDMEDKIINNLWWAQKIFTEIVEDLGKKQVE